MTLFFLKPYNQSINQSIMEIQKIGATITIGDSEVVKKGARVGFLEMSMMDYIRKNTTIPVPKILEFREDDDMVEIIMERVHGTTLREALNTLSTQNLLKICDQLHGYIRQMQSLKNNTINNQSTDIFYPKPYNDMVDTKDFNDYWFDRLSGILHKDKVEFIRPLLRDDYDLVFCHGDLNVDNILVDDDLNICCILDWEYAGFFPVFWEYVRMHNVPMIPERWLHYVNRLTLSSGIEDITTMLLGYNYIMQNCLL